MTRNDKPNESLVREVRKISNTKITTIPKCIVDALHIDNGDVLEWGTMGDIIVITIRKTGVT